ncbi:hypothetical protein BD626DRAFT_274137 [Schizophyllum amplum]|uniref:Uncharacterized protein n=1 Tax=Schizophyllum amplum TaxID=97359 RepID=A0A550CFN5_9AGAR|nr:hypothetical protein BD626DRAFT_274137 [Auriculariopsis ampla]
MNPRRSWLVGSRVVGPKAARGTAPRLLDPQPTRARVRACAEKSMILTAWRQRGVRRYPLEAGQGAFSVSRAGREVLVGGAGGRPCRRRLWSRSGGPCRYSRSRTLSESQRVHSWSICGVGGRVYGVDRQFVRERYEEGRRFTKRGSGLRRGEAVCGAERRFTK